MRKKTIVILLLMAVPAITAPVAAAGYARVGEQLNLFGSVTSMPAGTPFHVAHGWALDPTLPTERPPGAFGFALEVDGVLHTEDFVNRTVIHHPYLEQLWVHNFPDGMTDTHTFNGHWLVPCRSAVDEGYYPGPCPNPNAQVEVLTLSLTVTFVPVP